MQTHPDVQASTEERGLRRVSLRRTALFVPSDPLPPETRKRGPGWTSGTMVGAFFRGFVFMFVSLMLRFHC